MKQKTVYIAIAASMLTVTGASAQSIARQKFAVKATADFGLGKALNIDSALPEMSVSTSSQEYGAEFGWVFWNKGHHSLDANIGFGYRVINLTGALPEMKYSYSAPATADMDNEPYIRYYEVGDMHQRNRTNQLVMPIYLNYNYQINDWIGVHALAGCKLAFLETSKMKSSSVDVFSYGVYPQYDDLMIDAPYMNEFGERSLDRAQTIKPSGTGTVATFMCGVGAEILLFGPISADITLRYEVGAGNVFKKCPGKITEFTSENAPVRYTVADGQQAASLTSYFSKSNISRLSCALSLIYRF